MTYDDAYHIGLTATPIRLDGKGLDKFFSNMITGPSVAELIGTGALAPYRMFAPGGPNLTGVRKRMGDYVKSDLQAACDKPSITGSAIKEYDRHARGRRAICFAVSVEHSKHICQQFQGQGIHAVHVDATTPKRERDLAVKSFKEGRISVLSNVDLFGEGFDVPGADAGILLRPTQSLGLFLQQCGRVLRPGPDKTAIILDHAGNAMKHGLPDADRAWTLQGIERGARDKDSEPGITICTQCFAAQPSGLSSCKFCGYSLPIKPRVVEEVEGDLVEVSSDDLRKQRKQEEWSTDSLEELKALGRKRGYQNPNGWAWLTWKRRGNK